MNLTKDEERLLENHRYLKKECDRFQVSEFSIPACSFDAGKGIYMCVLRGEFRSEVD